MVTIASGIRGITDRKPRAPRVGKIKLGVIVERNGKEYPQATEHFVVPELVASVYGEKPTELDILLPSDDMEIVAPYNLKQYGSGTGLKCRGDGVNASGLVSITAYDKWAKAAGWEAATGDVPETPPPVEVWGGGEKTKREWRPLPCFGWGYDDAPPCPAFESKACRSMMHLQFVMPRVPALGVWQMDIGSKVSITRILDFLQFLSSFTGGKIAGIPLTLRMVPIDVAPDGQRRTVHVVELAYEGGMETLSAPLTGPMINSMEIPEPEEEDILTLPPAPDDIDIETGEILEGEVVAVDEEARPVHDPRTIIPDVNDLPQLMRWAHATFELQPAAMWELLGVANGRELQETFEGSYREAAKVIIDRVRSSEVADRMYADAPPLPSDGAEGVAVPNVPDRE